MTHFILAAATVAGLLTALPAAAQFRNAEAAVKYRQGVMQVQGFHLGRITGMANGRIPFDAKLAAQDAQVVATVSKLPFLAFGDGTDKVAGSRAKPEIWTERAKFEAAAQKYQDEAVKLNAAAQTGNLDAIKAAVGAVGQSCKACHDAYQAQ
jgi:cytochrome c556